MMRPSDAQVLLAAVESPAQRPEDEAILSEILALRKIAIKLLYGDKSNSSDRTRN